MNKTLSNFIIPQVKKSHIYLCDGFKECSLSMNCYKNGGECEHTRDVRHARINLDNQYLDGGND